MIFEKTMLSEFFEKASMRGEIREAILDFNEKGLICKTACVALVKLCHVTIPVTGIKNYKALGAFGIKDMATLWKLVNRFKDKVAVTIKGNFLHMKEGPIEAVISLADKDIISKPPELNPEKLNYKYTTKLDISRLRDVLSDVESMSGAKIIIEINKDVIRTIADSGLDKLKRTSKVETVSDEMLSTTFNVTHLKKIVTCITAPTVMMTFGTDKPIRMKEQSGQLTAIFFVTPWVEDEDEKSDEKPEVKTGEPETEQDDY